MDKLSVRHKNAIKDIGGIGISSTALKKWAEMSSINPEALKQREIRDEINNKIAKDYANAKPVHRFVLKSNEPAEIRSSGKFYYVAAIRRNGRHDILTIQNKYKETDKSKKFQDRLVQEWLDKVYKGEISFGKPSK